MRRGYKIEHIISSNSATTVVAQRGSLSLDKDLSVATELSLHVIPGASKSEVADCKDGIWKVRLTAPPVDGRANLALIEFLAGKLKVSRSRVVLCAGKASRYKKVAVYGLGVEELNRRLAAK